MNAFKHNYYEVLKVHPKASLEEVILAYQQAKNAFSKDSMATYTLFNEEDVRRELKEIDEAYAVLSNLHKRVAYDRALAKGEAAIMDFLVHKDDPVTTATKPSMPIPAPKEAPVLLALEDKSGSGLRSLREQKGLSLEEVSSATKIGIHHLTAIEKEDFSKLPARVYLQGFLKNLCRYYKIEPASFCEAYLKKMEPPAPPVPAK